MGRVLWWVVVLALVFLGQFLALGVFFGAYVFFKSVWNKPVIGSYLKQNVDDDKYWDRN